MSLTSNDGRHVTDDMTSPFRGCHLSSERPQPLPAEVREVLVAALADALVTWWKQQPISSRLTH